MAQSLYRRRITFTELLKAYAASIITSFLNSPFHKSSSRCQTILRILLFLHLQNLKTINTTKTTRSNLNKTNTIHDFQSIPLFDQTTQIRFRTRFNSPNKNGLHQCPNQNLKLTSGKEKKWHPKETKITSHQRIAINNSWVYLD